MALPSAPNSLSFSEIENEFGSPKGRNLGAYRVSRSVGDMSNIPLDEGIGQVEDDETNNSIRFSQFRGSRLNIIVHYSQEKIRDNGGWYKFSNNEGCTVIGPSGRVKPKPGSSSGTRITLHVSNKLGSNNASRERCALRTGDGWNNNTKININIGFEGSVYGAGGNGGNGTNHESQGERGGDGSSAIGIAHPVDKITVQTNGIVQAGGGGGGGGGGALEDSGGNERKAGGGGGGGGAGFPAGSAGGGKSVSSGSSTPGKNGDNGQNGQLNFAGQGGGGGNNDAEAYGGGGGGGGSALGGAPGGGSKDDGEGESGKDSVHGSNGTTEGGGSGGTGKGDEESSGGSGGANGYAVVTKGFSIPSIIGSINGDTHIASSSTNI